MVDRYTSIMVGYDTFENDKAPNSETQQLQLRIVFEKPEQLGTEELFKRILWIWFNRSYDPIGAFLDDSFGSNIARLADSTRIPGSFWYSENGEDQVGNMHWWKTKKDRQDGMAISTL